MEVWSTFQGLRRSLEEEPPFSKTTEAHQSSCMVRGSANSACAFAAASAQHKGLPFCLCTFDALNWINATTSTISGIIETFPMLLLFFILWSSTAPYAGWREVFYPYPSPERVSVFGLCYYCRFQDTVAAPLTTAVSERSVRVLQAERAIRMTSMAHVSFVETHDFQIGILQSWFWNNACERL